MSLILLSFVSFESDSFFFFLIHFDFFLNLQYLILIAKSFSVLFFYLFLFVLLFLTLLVTRWSVFSFVFICMFSKVDIQRNPIILYKKIHW